MPYWVYVIELEAEALSVNDRKDLGKGALYVGYTSKTPEARLLQHQTRVLAGHVFKRMIDPSRCALHADLADDPGPFESLDRAKEVEDMTHGRLEDEGYKVFGDRGKDFEIPTRD